MTTPEHKSHPQTHHSPFVPAGIVFIVLGSLLAYSFVRINTLAKDVASLTQQEQRISAELSSTTAALAINTNELTRNIRDLRSETIGLSNSLSTTQQNVQSVQTQVGGVQETVGSLSGTLTTLQKLAKTAPELLKKYSKVYFLNENFVPANLSEIPKQYLYSETRPELYLTEALPFLIKMFDTAKANGVDMYVRSAYRSFATQQALKSTYSVIYGAGTANSFSSDQGYSEHQLGTALDIIAPGQNGVLEGFDKTKAYAWMLANAHLFGFTLSYPEKNTYYIFEPWHWRFVGVKLATYMHSNNLKFYDMDQRDIDTYLVTIFD